MSDILEFSGNNRWLSNFWLTPIVMGDYVFPSTENAYQAAKYPRAQRQQFTNCSPAMAKKLGGKIELPTDWDGRKLAVMVKALNQKFRVGNFLALQLVATGDRKIVEGNDWGDTYWGVCEGKGYNNLGRILMDIRQNLIDKAL